MRGVQNLFEQLAALTAIPATSGFEQGTVRQTLAATYSVIDFTLGFGRTVKRS
jgi:hypothetical protein